MSLGPWEICIPTASGWSRMRREIYKLEQCRMPRYSRVPYHQKGTRTHDLRQTTEDVRLHGRFHRISWWLNASQMVQAAHTVMSCCSLTLEQRRIICVGIQ